MTWRFWFVSFIPFFIFGFWSLLVTFYKNKKILCNLCLHLARQDGQERKKRSKTYATKVTEIPKTKIFIVVLKIEKRLVEDFYFWEWCSDKTLFSQWTLLYETIYSLQKCHLLFFRDPKLRSNYGTKSSKDTKITQIIDLTRCCSCIDGVT